MVSFWFFNTWITMANIQQIGILVGFCILLSTGTSETTSNQSHDNPAMDAWNEQLSLESYTWTVNFMYIEKYGILVNITEIARLKNRSTSENGISKQKNDKLCVYLSQTIGNQTSAPRSEAKRTGFDYFNVPNRKIVSDRYRSVLNNSSCTLNDNTYDVRVTTLYLPGVAKFTLTVYQYITTMIPLYCFGTVRDVNIQHVYISLVPLKVLNYIYDRNIKGPTDFDLNISNRPYFEKKGPENIYNMQWVLENTTECLMMDRSPIGINLGAWLVPKAMYQSVLDNTYLTFVYKYNGVRSIANPSNECRHICEELLADFLSGHHPVFKWLYDVQGVQAISENIVYVYIILALFGRFYINHKKDVKAHSDMAKWCLYFTISIILCLLSVLIMIDVNAKHMIGSCLIFQTSYFWDIEHNNKFCSIYITSVKYAFLIVWSQYPFAIFRITRLLDLIMPEWPKSKQSVHKRTRKLLNVIGNFMNFFFVSIAYLLWVYYLDIVSIVTVVETLITMVVIYYLMELFIVFKGYQAPTILGTINDLIPPNLFAPPHVYCTCDA